MKYISLIHALNIPCSLETCGDWHASVIQWERPHILESDNSLWGDYGIEKIRPFLNITKNIMLLTI